MLDSSKLRNFEVAGNLGGTGRLCEGLQNLKNKKRPLRGSWPLRGAWEALLGEVAWEGAFTIRSLLL